MSIDYYIYTKNLAPFSNKRCEAYIRERLGLDVEIHPDYDAHSDTGFLPIRIDGRFVSDALAGASFLSGFEIRLDQSEVFSAASEPAVLTGNGIAEKTDHKEPYEDAVKHAAYRFSINCSWQDSFEVLLAYAFSTYVCEKCDSVFYDPQEDQFFDDESLLIVELDAIKDELKSMYENGELLTHDFSGWQ